nr:MAG TPA: hypothetical protein [Caudoviricetes sp.]
MKACSFLFRIILLELLIIDDHFKRFWLFRII